MNLYASQSERASSGNLTLKLLIILSTTFAFFQAANIIKIDYILMTIFILSVMVIFIEKMVLMSGAVIYYLIMLMFMTLSLVYTVDRTATLKYILVMIVGLFIYNLISTQSRLANLHKYFSTVVVAFSLINVFITLSTVIFPSVTSKLILTLLPNVDTEFSFASGILGQTGTNSYVISFSIVYFATVLMCGTKRKLITILLLALSSVALVFTGKRGPVLWVIITILMIGILFNYHNKKKSVEWILYYALISGLFVALFSYLSSNELIRESFYRFLELKEIDENYSRIKLYKAAIEIIKQSPVLGIGAGAYNYYGMGAHNDYLQLIAENGVLSAALYFLFIISNLRFSIKKYSQIQTRETLFFVGIQILLILIALTGTSFLHYGFFLIYIQVAAACNNNHVNA